MSFSSANIFDAAPNTVASSKWWERVLGKSTIVLYDKPYMVRYRFFNAPRWLGGWGIRVHHILRSDVDRELHDHPFDFWSFIIAGPGYVETTLAGARYYPRWSIVKRHAEDFHRLSLTAPVWTIVIRGRIRRTWGFRLDTGHWMHWRDFSNMKGTLGSSNYVSSESKITK